MQLTRPAWRIVAANIAPAFVGSALALYITELKHAGVLPLPAVGLVMTAISTMTFAGPLLGGWLSRIWRARSIIWLALALFLLGLAGLGATVWLPLLLLAFAALGLAYTLVVVVSSAELGRRFPDDTYSVIAIQLAATAVGGMLSPPLAAALLAWRPVAQTPQAGLPLAVSGAVVALACVLPAQLCGDYRSPPSRHRGRLPWRLWPLGWLLLLAGLHGACDISSWVWMPVWMQDRGHAGPSQIAAMISLTWVAALIGRGMTVVLGRRIGVARAVRLSAVGAAAGIILTGLTHQPAAMTAAYCLYCVWAAGNLPGMVALISARLAEWRGEVTGLVLAVINGAGSLGTIALAQAAARTGNSSYGIPLIVLCMATYAAIILSYRRLWPQTDRGDGGASSRVPDGSGLPSSP